MKKDLVSVVVPIYNVEKYLDRCLNSIINQTYRNLEILLIDDGSPDKCPEMCDVWAKKDSRIKVIHKKNAGLGMARNTGIENATGEYICFFDSDDYVELETVEKAYSLAKTASAEIVIFGMSSVDRYGRITNRSIPEPVKSCYYGDEVQRDLLPDLIDSRNDAVKNKNLCLSVCSCLFSMGLVGRTNWRFVSERQNISEDSYAIIGLYKHVRSVAILTETLYYYCENEASLTHAYREDRFEKIKQFFYDCCLLADQLEYGREIHVRISGLFLSFSLAAMKQIMAADIKNRKKKQLLAQIAEDEIMQSILADPGCRYKSRARKVLFAAMRHKLNWLTYILVKLQVQKR